MELGNCAEARNELNKVSPDHAQHPDVLEMSWSLHAEDQNWQAALDVAHALLQVAPHRATGWLHQAYSLRRAPGGGVGAAREALLPAADGFPEEPAIPFNLACYACQLGKLSEARQWLKTAVERSDNDTIKMLALKDSDLKPLWKEIRQW